MISQSAGSRTCGVTTVRCDRPVMSASAEFCRRHAQGIAETYLVASAAAFEDKVTRDRQRMERTARLGSGRRPKNHGGWD